MSNRFRAVLFDWRGTLFHDEDDADWVRASAALVGRTLSAEHANALARTLGAASEHPEVVASLLGFSLAQLLGFTRNAVAAAFTTPTRKADLLRELDKHSVLESSGPERSTARMPS